MLAIYDIDAVGLGVRNMLLHEAAESRQIGANVRDAHDRAFS